MPEWVPVAAAGAVLLVFLLIILVKVVGIGRDQTEIVRTLNLLMDTVEFQTESISRKIEKESAPEPTEQPSMIGYRKPSLRDDGSAKAPPPPPPPAKLKRW